MVNWQQIETVLLDMDGTLLDLHFDNQFWLHHLPKRYYEIHGSNARYSPQELTTLFKSQQGLLNWYCLDYWSKQLQVDIVALKIELQHLICERPLAYEFLQSLRQSSRQVVLITNAHRDSLTLKLDRTRITPFFHTIVSSHDYGHPKEAPQFWQELQQQQQFNPIKTLFIDDSIAVLNAAHQYGISHLLTLLQPDSQGVLRNADDLPFTAFHHFDEIIPPRIM